MSNGTEKKVLKKKFGGMKQGEVQKAIKLWIKLSKAVDDGYEVLLRDRSGQNTIVDIENP